MQECNHNKLKVKRENKLLNGLFRYVGKGGGDGILVANFFRQQQQTNQVQNCQKLKEYTKIFLQKIVVLSIYESLCRLLCRLLIF